MPVGLQISALAISLIYYTWRDFYVAGLRRDRLIRHRVAYMLWVAALRME